MAVSEDDDTAGNRAVRQIGECIPEFEWPLGRRTLEVDILKEVLDKARKKTDVAHAVVAEGRFAVKALAETLGVSRSNLNVHLIGGVRPRRRYRKTWCFEVARFA